MGNFGDSAVSTPLRSCSPLRPNVIKISRACEVVLKVNAPYHREFSRDLDVLSVDSGRPESECVLLRSRVYLMLWHLSLILLAIQYS